MTRLRFRLEGAFTEGAAGFVGATRDTVVRLSEEERELCRALEAAYDRLHVLARAGERDGLAAEAARAQAIGARLEQVAAHLNPLRGDHAPETPVHVTLCVLWNETADALQRIVRWRDDVLSALGAASADVRSRLVRLGTSRPAIAAYGKGWAGERRRCARRV
jgi:hypothetical protein